MLVAQRFGKVAHGLLTGATLTAFALRYLHVFHQLTEHFHQFGRFLHPAFFQHLLQLFQELLQLIAGHLHALLFLRGLSLGVARGLFGQLAHVILHRLTQFLHQLFDFRRVGPVADCLVQPVLGALKPLSGRGKIALFDHQGDFPQRLCKLIPNLGRQAGGSAFQAAQGHAEAKIGALVADKPFGAVGDRLENLNRAAGVFTVPQKIAAHFDHSGGQRVKEPLARQHQR